MTMRNRTLGLVLSSTFLAAPMTFGKTYKYPKVYPFVPFTTAEVHNAVERMSEDSNYLSNFNDIISQDLSKAQTKTKPWTSTYWPLNKGLIADPYETTFVGYYVERGFFSWTKNYRTFKGRKNGILKNIDKYSSEQLNMLAPSEKYDLLLGDKSFDLTNRLWDYMHKWGSQKEHGFLSHLALVGEDALEIAKDMVNKKWYDTIDAAFADAYQLRGSLAVDKALELVKTGKYQDVESAMSEAIQIATDESQNYVLEKKNKYMAFWEGICHGWATAAGIIPRPRKTIQFSLPDGRSIKFYPTDVKALVSLLWANSLIQDNKNIDKVSGKNIGGGVIMQGYRCNLKNAKKDIWGRVYDSSPDPFAGDLKPRCIGVHPAIWHLSLVNIIGKQGRSFIVERKVSEEVDNHPMYSYRMKYFNPNTGKYRTKMKHNIVEIDNNDQFKQFRNPKAKYIVGVDTKMTYIDWKRPQRFFKDSESMDETTDKKMYYDLELDANYNIIGGQWRAVRTSRVKKAHNRYHRNATQSKKGTNNQPDFFWVITKNWKPFFSELTDLDSWSDTSKAPPKSWLSAALGVHKFIYHKKYMYGTGQKCKVFHKRTGKMKEVSCEFEEPRPQPLLNVVNKLIELSQ